MSFAAILAILLASGSGILSIEDAIDTALANHPDLLISRSRIRIADAGITESRSAILPKVDSTLSYDVSGGASPSRPFAVGDSYRASVSAGMPVYDFGRSRLRIRSSEINSESSRLEYSALEREIIFNVRLAYIDILEAGALLEVAKENLENEKRNHESTKVFVETGRRPKIDLVRFETRIAESKAALVKAESDLDLMRARLLRLIGAPGYSGSFEVIEPSMPPLETEELPIEELLLIAYTERDDLESSRLSIAMRELGVQHAELGMRPSFRIGAGTGIQGDDFREPGLNASVGLTMTWPLFNGYSQDAALAVEQQQLMIEKTRLNANEQNIWTDIREAQSLINSQKAQLEASVQALLSAKELLRLAEARYAEGVGDSIELTQAQLDVTSAQARKVRAEYNLAAARARMLRAIGRKDWT